MRFLTVIVLLFFSAGIHAQSKNEGYQSADSVVIRCLAALSGKKGEQRDWKKFKSYFRNNATLIAVDTAQKGANEIREFTLDQFIKLGGSLVEHDFQERALQREIKEHNGIAQISQKYELVIDGKKEYGVNQFTLVWANDRWWISHLVWSKISK